MSEVYDGLAVGIGLFVSDALQAQEPWCLVPRRWSAPDERPKSPGVQGIFSTFLVDVITFANGATRPWVCLAWRISANAKRMPAALCDSIPLRRLRSTIHRHVPTVVRVLFGETPRAQCKIKVGAQSTQYWMYILEVPGFAGLSWMEERATFAFLIWGLLLPALPRTAVTRRLHQDPRHDRMCRPTDAQ
ncbi:hypothetical protein SCUP515_12032 [Seiridium cupressi]